MAVVTGILLALGAMVCWGLGDFLIQRCARKVGPTETLFLITAFGGIVLTPFVIGDLARIALWTRDQWGLLVVSTIGILGSALLHFEGLRRGKIAVIEPFLSLEIPLAAFLAYLLVGETLGIVEAGLMAAIITGLFLLALESSVRDLTRAESGIAWGFFGALFMGVSNFFVGIAARETSPYLVNWFLSAAVALVTAMMLTVRGAWKEMRVRSRAAWKEIVPMVIVDNLAWVLFAFAAVMTSIAIAVGISEAYLIIAVLLGMWVNKETLRTHQRVGLIVAIVAVIALAFMVG